MVAELLRIEYGKRETTSIIGGGKANGVATTRPGKCMILDGDLQRRWTTRDKTLDPTYIPTTMLAPM